MEVADISAGGDEDIIVLDSMFKITVEEALQKWQADGEKDNSLASLVCECAEAEDVAFKDLVPNDGMRARLFQQAYAFSFTFAREEDQNFLMSVLS